MDTCVACGAELGVGRFCLNCGHRVGAPAPVAPPVDEVPAPRRDERPEPPPWRRVFTPSHHTDKPAEPTRPAEPTEPTEPAGPAEQTEPAAPAAPLAPPVQAADPTAVPAPTSDPPPAESVAEPPEPAEPAEPAAERAPEPTAEPVWDPRVDLLPYEEVDDPHRDDPVRGLAWLGWVAAAVVLVVLAMVLMNVFATDEEDATATDGTVATSRSESSDPEEPGASADPTAEVPTGTGKVRDFADRARFDVPGTAPATTDFDGNLVAYAAVQMHDNNPTTTWRTEGDATGETITITLPQAAVISRVGMINGYAKKVAGVNWYPNNRRILSATWEFDDGSSVEQTFAEKPGMQRMKVPPVETSAVRLTITSVTPPGSGNLGRDYTAISEVTLMGRRAG